MENNVVSLDLAKRLKLAGFPQDGTLAGWYRADGNDIVLPRMIMSVNYNWIWNLPWHQIGLIAAAVTAQEIADMLPDWSIITTRIANEWSAEVFGGPYCGVDTTLANALGELWLLVQEQPHAKG